VARVRERVAIPFATNMCVIDLHGIAVALRMRSVDVVLGDIFEWGGISRIKKLEAACDIFQFDLSFHNAGELGIETAYLHLAASVPTAPCP
jgi:glucarate dehydratase